MRCEERSAERGGLAALAVEHVGQQLEVGEDRGQRRAQLVRGVGHELALAVQGALGLLARGLQAVEHGLQRAGELGDLVVGRAAGGATCDGSRVRSMSRAAAVSAATGSHRAAAEHDAAEQREQRAAEDAGGEEEADARGPWPRRRRPCARTG